MAKSSTRKKSANKLPPEVREVADLFTEYLQHWTTQELGRLQELRDTSICVPVNDGYRIGLYRLRVNTNKTCTLFDRNGELVHTFDSKVSGVLYTIYMIKQKYTNADRILGLDREINKHYTDVLTLKRGIANALRSRDYDSVDIKNARLDVAERRLQVARREISAMHTIAKCNKVWQ